MRFVVLGAGAIGGAIGGRLHQHGADVVLIARGEHYAALKDRGLELRDPTGTVVLDIPAVDSPAAARPGPGDVVIVATKTQQSAAALADLAAAAGVPAAEIAGSAGTGRRRVGGTDGPAVVLAQNGVENERLALRRFADVYPMRVILAASHVEPGVVEIATAPLWGILDLGRFPRGSDDLAETVAAELRGAGFDARTSEDVMAHKYLKLLSNLANAVEAACGPLTSDDLATAVIARARAEARACYEAAGIRVADAAAEAERRRLRGFPKPVAGLFRAGGSSWQSLQRGTGDIEADYLNGEIVLLGRLHGIPTPVNERLQRVANDMARRRQPPGSVSAEVLAAGLDIEPAAP